MEKVPKFIKDFTKEKFSEERQRIVGSVKAVRQEHYTKIKNDEEEAMEKERITKENERALAEKLEQINTLKNEISRLSESGLSKLLNYFELKKIQADLAIGQKTYEELKQQLDLGLAVRAIEEEGLDTHSSSPLLKEARDIVEGFYDKKAELWENTEYKKEDIEKYFSESNLSSLSTEEYVLLLKRFPSEMVAHVTRQNIRDHLGHMFHTAGEGEYANGFKRMVEDGRLRSPLGVYLIEEEKEKAIAKFLRLDELENKEDALKNLEIMTDPKQDQPGSYIDRMAVHFATEEVADGYYGSEKGNEIFIAYPSAYIASQYYFDGQLNKNGGGYWNDQWVWANEEKGMGLNAGFVFIPEEANVDKETGSRYELDKEKNPIKNSEYIEKFRKLIDSENFDDLAKEAMDITGHLPGDSFSEMESNKQYNKSYSESFELLKPLFEKLEKDFNITDPRMQWAVLGYHNLQEISIEKKEEQSSIDEDNSYNNVNLVIERALKEEGILFKETNNKIKSKEYWESHFNKDIKNKPAHIIYYKGEDPTKALNKWKEENGLNKKAVDQNIGFSEKRIPQADAPQAIAGMDRFKSLAEKVIEDYYAE